MKTIALTLLFAMAACAADTAPDYDSKTEINITAQLDGSRVVTTGPLQGTYLTVRHKDEALDVYLAPSMFVKDFDLQFQRGKDVNLIGSRVKFDGKDLILAREIRMGETDLTLRDAKGQPEWLWMTQANPPKGL